MFGIRIGPAHFVEGLTRLAHFDRLAEPNSCFSVQSWIARSKSLPDSTRAELAVRSRYFSLN